jgi:hypothetical protein
MRLRLSEFRSFPRKRGSKFSSCIPINGSLNGGAPERYIFCFYANRIAISKVVLRSFLAQESFENGTVNSETKTKNEERSSIPEVFKRTQPLIFRAQNLSPCPRNLSFPRQYKMLR